MREIFKRLGIKTFEDLARFKADQLRHGETLEECAVRYLKSLGENWKIREGQ